MPSRPQLAAGEMGKKKTTQKASDDGICRVEAGFDVSRHTERLESFLREREAIIQEVDVTETRDALRDLEEWQKDAYISRLADNNLRALGMLKHCLHAARQMLAGQNLSKTPGHVNAKDIEVNPAEAVHKQYSDMVLWTETARVNAKICAAAEKHLGTTDGAVDVPDMRATYMEQLTEAFGDDLDKLRKEGNLDAGRVVALAEALEQGKDIWSPEEIAMWCASAGGSSVHLKKTR